VAGRAHPDLEGVIGYLGNTLPIRVSLADDPPFTVLVERVRAACLEAYDRQDVPFEVLALEVQRGRAASHAPIFQSLFTLHDVNPVAFALADVAVEPLAFETGWAKLDLVLDAGVRGDGALQLALNVRADLFAPDTADRMLTHADTLLRSIAHDASQHLSALSLLPDAERRLLLETWNDTAGEYPRDRDVAQLPSRATSRSRMADVRLTRPARSVRSHSFRGRGPAPVRPTPRSGRRPGRGPGRV